MTNYTNLLVNFMDLLLKSNSSQEETFNFIFDLINKNYEKQKLYHNQYITSSNGFLLNFSQGLLKILIEKSSDLDYQEFSSSYNSFLIINEIDALFSSINTPLLNLERFERINHTLASDFLKNEKEKINSKNFNKITKLFFSIHVLISYIIKNLETEYTNVLSQLGKMFQMQLYNDPKT